MFLGLAVAMALLVSPAIAAEKTEKTPPKPAVVHKLVYVNGVQSMVMLGDGTDLPIQQNVLPSLLAEGWLIKSVHVDRDAKAQKVGGYVVLERARQ